MLGPAIKYQDYFDVINAHKRNNGEQLLDRQTCSNNLLMKYI
jgi:hypothetical protein